MNLLHRRVSLSNRTTILTILFALHFKVNSSCSSEFIFELERTLADLEIHRHGPIADQHEIEAASARRMIISLAVSASANDANHRAILESGFYTQFKKGLNENPKEEAIELVGLFNIALNPKYIGQIWHDLKRIYKEVFRSKMEFRSQVDLFSACSRYLTSQKEATEASSGASKALIYCLMRLLKRLMRK
jgi:hypothetical protein